MMNAAPVNPQRTDRRRLDKPLGFRARQPKENGRGRKSEEYAASGSQIEERLFQRR